MGVSSHFSPLPASEYNDSDFFFVKSVHSRDLDWHDQYSLTSDTKTLPSVGNT